MRTRNILPIKRRKKIAISQQLPIVVNLNPRSTENKQNSIKEMIKVLKVDICTISESWDKETGQRNNAVEEAEKVESYLHMDGFKVIKNVYQRQKRGGKPIVIVREDKYFVTELCPNIITVPTELEITWVLLTPKVLVEKSPVTHIVVASLYYTEKTKRSLFLDHISSSFHHLLSIYGENTQWIFSGDYNRLNEKPICSLSSKLTQIVDFPTRLNPDRTLDKIVTSLHHWYQSPVPLPPLQCDPDKVGRPSDHLGVLWEPLSDEFPAREMRTVTFLPLPDSSVRSFCRWISNHDWSDIYNAQTSHEKADIFQK